MAVYYCSALIDQGNHNSLGKLIFSFSTRNPICHSQFLLSFLQPVKWESSTKKWGLLKTNPKCNRTDASRQLDHFEVLFILSSLNKKERKKVKKRNRWWANISFIKPRTVISTSFIFQTHAGTFKASIT